MSRFRSHLALQAPTLPPSLSHMPPRRVISTRHEPVTVAVHHHMSRLRVLEAGDDGHRLLPAILSVRFMWKNAHAQAERLLRVLQLWNSRLSAQATRNGTWRVVESWRQSCNLALGYRLGLLHRFRSCWLRFGSAASPCCSVGEHDAFLHSVPHLQHFVS